MTLTSFIGPIRPNKPPRNMTDSPAVRRRIKAVAPKPKPKSSIEKAFEKFQKMRREAYLFTGNYDSRRCYYCLKWDTQSNMELGRGRTKNHDPVWRHPGCSPDTNQRRIAEFRLRAESALGHPFPPDALVYNLDDSLVICPDAAYHHLLQARRKSLIATGSTNNRQCPYCKVWDTQQNMIKYTGNHPWAHRTCENAARQARNRTYPKPIEQGLPI